MPPVSTMVWLVRTPSGFTFPARYVVARFGERAATARSILAFVTCRRRSLAANPHASEIAAGLECIAERCHRRSGEAINPVPAFRPRRASPGAEVFPQTAPGQRAGRTMVLCRKGCGRALIGKRSGSPSGPSTPAGPSVRTRLRAGKRRLGVRCLPESRRRNSRGVRMARSHFSDLPGTAGVLAGIVGDGAPLRGRSPDLRGSAGFRNGRERASRGPARTPALPGRWRAGTGYRSRARLRPVIPELPDRPRPGRPPAPRPRMIATGFTPPGASRRTRRPHTLKRSGWRPLRLGHDSPRSSLGIPFRGRRGREGAMNAGAISETGRASTHRPPGAAGRPGRLPRHDGRPPGVSRSAALPCAARAESGWKPAAANSRRRIAG